MSNIEKWGYIYKAYDECSRSAILRKQFSFEKVRENYGYWVLASIYVAISLLALYFIQIYFFWSIFSVALTAVCIYLITEYKLSKDFYRYYKPNKLKHHPLFSRSKYLSYLLFKEKLGKDGVIVSGEIESLITWDEIRNEKIDTMEFFKSKWFLVLLTGITALLGQYMLGLNLGIKQLVLIAWFVLVLLWLAWLVYDFSNSARRKRLDINRFLRWFKLDSEKT